MLGCDNLHYNERSRTRPNPGTQAAVFTRKGGLGTCRRLYRCVNSEHLNFRPKSAQRTCILLDPVSSFPQISKIKMSPDLKLNIFTYAEFNIQALRRQASTLRRGISCACDPGQRPVSGSFNWAVFISFEDGVRWVFRSPHARTFMPIEMGIKLLASEAATLRYLRAHSDIPVPEVYDYW